MGVIATITFLNRIAGPFIMSRLRTSARVERFLDAMSVSVIVALISSALARGTIREVVAVGASALAMLWFNNAIVALIAGTSAAALWLKFLA
ncbi:AzlD domain-containing protein [Ruegeria meonggei]